MPGDNENGPVRDFGALRLRSFRTDDAHVVELAGEFDVAAIAGVERELECIRESHVGTIVLDLRGLSFLDSAGVRVVAMAHRRLRDRLVIVRGHHPVQRVFEICGLDKLLRFIDEPPRLLPRPSRRAAALRRANQAALAAAVRELHAGARASRHSGMPGL
jgi:anti-sigma B factor antagonist